MAYAPTCIEAALASATAVALVWSSSAAMASSGAKSNRAALVGEWTSQCHGVAWPPFLSARDTLIYAADGHFGKRTTLHTEAGCGGFEAVLAIRGAYDLVGRKGPERSLIDLEYTVDGVDYTPVSLELAATLSEGAFCGRNDWRAGEARSITGLVCFGESLDRDLSVPEVIQAKAGSLEVGAPTIWLTSADGFAHPEQVDKDRTYRRRR